MWWAKAVLVYTGALANNSQQGVIVIASRSRTDPQMIKVFEPSDSGGEIDSISGSEHVVVVHSVSDNYYRLDLSTETLTRTANVFAR